MIRVLDSAGSTLVEWGRQQQQQQQQQQCCIELNLVSSLEECNVFYS